MRRELHTAITSVFPDSSLEDLRFRQLSISYHHKDEEIEKLKADIEQLKIKHLDEVISLKLKISELVDQNYRLHTSK
jgi:hypothetical protein